MALTRLKVDRREQKAISKDLEKIIGYIAELSAARVGDAEPMTGGTNLVNRMRNDAERVDSFRDKDALLDQAPDSKNRYFKVPRILE